MTPIVDGLEDEFADQLSFLRLNAEDGAEGQATFDRLRLPGHPTFLIFTPDGQEQERVFGVVKEEVLRRAIQNTLDGG